MAFVVEDGTGLANATAYIDIAFANSYHTDRGNDRWTQAGPAEKQQAIVRATDYLEQQYDWQGQRLTATQALSWPRNAAFDLSGVEVGLSSVPDQVQRACAELALAALCRDLDPDSPEGLVTQESFSAAGVSQSRTLAGTQPAFHKAEKILYGIIAARQLLRC